MACNSCQSKFSFFTRENGCPNCGFSYCSKCLKHKCEISNGNVKKVCGPCYNKFMSRKSNSDASSSSLSSPEEVHEPLASIDIEKKLNSLDNPTKPPIVIYKQDRWETFKTGLEPADQAIVDRLKKLKEERTKNPPLSTEDIRRRLALLKDQDPDYIPATNIHQVETRSEQEQSNDLIRQYMETLALSKTDPADDIEKRLNALKDINSANSSSNIPDGDDEQSVTKHLIKKALAEAALENKFQDVDDLEEMDFEPSDIHSDDEDVQCATCEQTKNLVECTGCPHDLYCMPCFEENHDEFELKKHRPVSVKSRRPMPD